MGYGARSKGRLGVQPGGGCAEVEAELLRLVMDGHDSDTNFDEFHHLHCYLRFVGPIEALIWLLAWTVPLCLHRSDVCLDFRLEHLGGCSGLLRSILAEFVFHLLQEMKLRG